MPSPDSLPIALVGLRGSGKTTLGRLLAAALGWEFVDLDQKVVELARQQGIDVANAGELLEQRGLPAFRALESAALAQCLAGARARVIATGGGVVEDPANRGRLRDSACSIWLAGDPEVLAARVQADPAARPPLVAGGPLAEASGLLLRRDPWYREVARLRIEIGTLTPAQILVQLLETLGEWERD